MNTFKNRMVAFLTLLCLVGGFAGCLDSFNDDRTSTDDNDKAVTWSRVVPMPPGTRFAGHDLMSIEDEFIAFSRDRKEMTSLQMEHLHKATNDEPYDFGSTLVGREFNFVLFFRDAKKSKVGINLQLVPRHPSAINQYSESSYITAGGSYHKSGWVNSARLSDAWRFEMTVPSEKFDEIAKFKRNQVIRVRARILEATGLVLDPKTCTIQRTKNARLILVPIDGIDRSNANRPTFAAIIIDNSGSASDYWDAMTSVADRIVWGLLPQDSFCVSVWPSQTKIKSASFENQWEAVRAIATSIPEGSFDVRSPMHASASINPTDVFFISDFEWEAGEIAFLRQSIENGVSAGVRFHVYSIVANASRRCMIDDMLQARIASNGGTFRKLTAADFEAETSSGNEPREFSMGDAIFTLIYLFAVLA